MAEYRHFADRAEAFMCPAAMIEKLSHAEVRALTHYQATFVAALHELYKTMDPRAADAFLLPLYLGFGDPPR